MKPLTIYITADEIKKIEAYGARINLLWVSVSFISGLLIGASIFALMVTI